MDHTTIAIFASFLMLLAAFILTLFRLFKGPSVNDRIAAMDLIASIVMGFIITYSMLVNRAIYFDVVIIISLISFIGTIGVSTYLKQKND
ncbi:MAG TPA: cation:proton antiporter [Bacteroidales bacterium]|jgi:multicomponent Na+:H+ antiporter subunit F|nr:cation:proton antiporter [Bacteroidales bacterium]